jgi:hypothetical protein
MGAMVTLRPTGHGTLVVVRMSRRNVAEAFMRMLLLFAVSACVTLWVEKLPSAPLWPPDPIIWIAEGFIFVLYLVMTLVQIPVWVDMVGRVLSTALATQSPD